MHDTAYRIGGLVLRTYCDLPSARVLEVGSLDVNGSLRKHVLPSTEYVGVDIEEGPGVDAVIEIGKPFPFEDATFDLVMASSVFEHDPAFWVTFMEMCRNTKPGGYIYISAPANGTVHRYPQDNWRFYPDAGLALARWAQAQDQDIELVESFTADRQGDVWNDFCAIFRKGPSTKLMPPTLVWHQVSGVNVHTWQSAEIFNPKDATEDMEIISANHARISQLEAELEATSRKIAEGQSGLEQQLSEARDQLETAVRENANALAAAEQGHAETRQRLADVERNLQVATESSEGLQRDLADAERDLQAATGLSAGLQRDLAEALQNVEHLVREREEQVRNLAESSSELEILRNRVSDLENNLRQRQEENEQSWAELATTKQERDTLQKRLEEAQDSEQLLRTKVSEADDWLFKLSGDRRAAEAKTREIAIALDAERRGRAAAEATADRTADQLSFARNEIGELKSKTDHAMARLRKRHDDIAALVDQLGAREKEILQIREEAEAARSTRDAALLAAQREGAELQLEVRQFGEREIALQRENRSQASSIAVNERQLAWLTRVNQVLAYTPGWRNLLPPRWRRRWELRVLQQTGLFDAEAYLGRYPDVAEFGMDPLIHYIMHGMREGRIADGAS